MDTLGYFLYLDSMEKQQNASADLSGDSSDSNENEEDE